MCMLSTTLYIQGNVDDIGRDTPLIVIASESLWVFLWQTSFPFSIYCHNYFQWGRNTSGQDVEVVANIWEIWTACSILCGKPSLPNGVIQCAIHNDTMAHRWYISCSSGDGPQTTTRAICLGYCRQNNWSTYNTKTSRGRTSFVINIHSFTSTVRWCLNCLDLETVEVRERISKNVSFKWSTAYNQPLCSTDFSKLSLFFLYSGLI